MAKKAVTKAATPEHVTVALLIESLKQLEWQCRYVRLALHRLDPATRIAATPEMKELLAAEPRKPNSMVPPC